MGTKSGKILGILMGMVSISDPALAMIGGETVRGVEFPAVVPLYIEPGICTGTLISKRTILTAAHCFYEYILANPEERANWKVRVLRDQWKVKRFDVHPKFNPYLEFMPDIAVITLEEDAPVAPVRVDYSDEADLKGEFQVVGYGMHYDRMGRYLDDGFDPNSPRVGRACIREEDDRDYFDQRTRYWWRRTFNSKAKSSKNCAQPVLGDSGAPLMINGALVGTVGLPDYLPALPFDSIQKFNMLKARYKKVSHRDSMDFISRAISSENQ